LIGEIGGVGGSSSGSSSTSIAQLRRIALMCRIWGAALFDVEQNIRWYKGLAKMSLLLDQ